MLSLDYGSAQGPFLPALPWIHCPVISSAHWMDSGPLTILLILRRGLIYRWGH